MSSDNVPFFDSLSSIYDSTILDEQRQRYQNLYDKFIELYNTPPSHIIRAPGRVNLIVLKPSNNNADVRANISTIPTLLSFLWQLLQIFYLPCTLTPKTLPTQSQSQTQTLDSLNEKSNSTPQIPLNP